MIESTTEVARADWIHTLNEFNAIHEGWLVAVEVLAPNVGAQPEVVDLPLVGVTFEPRPAPTMSIAAGGGDDLLVHVVPDPARLWIARASAHADAAIEIESGDGTKTIVRFTHPAAAESVDGVARTSGRAAHGARTRRS